MASKDIAVKMADVITVKALVQALKDRSEHVREKAAEDLGELGDSRAIKPLIEALRKDQSVHVRQRAAYALGQLGDAQASGPLVQALEDKSPSVRREAVEALGRLGYFSVVAPLIQAIVQDESTSVRERAGEVLENLIETLTKVREQCSEP